MRPWIAWAVGPDWPEGDETRLFELADALAAAFYRIRYGARGDGSAAGGATAGVRQDWEGEALREFLDHVRTDTTDRKTELLKRLAGLAVACNDLGVQIQYAKRMIKLSALFLIVQLGWLLWAALSPASGVAWAAAGARAQVTRRTIRALAKRLLLNIALFSLLGAGMELYVQASQDRREEIDWEQVLWAGFSGALTATLLTLSTGLWAPRSIVGLMGHSAAAGGLATLLTMMASGQPINWEAVAKGTTAGALGGADAHWASWNPGAAPRPPGTGLDGGPVPHVPPGDDLTAGTGPRPPDSSPPPPPGHTPDSSPPPPPGHTPDSPSPPPPGHTPDGPVPPPPARTPDGPGPPPPARIPESPGPPPGPAPHGPQFPPDPNAPLARSAGPDPQSPLARPTGPDPRVQHSPGPADPAFPAAHGGPARSDSPAAHAGPARSDGSAAHAGGERGHPQAAAQRTGHDGGAEPARRSIDQLINWGGDADSGGGTGQPHGSPGLPSGHLPGHDPSSPGLRPLPPDLAGALAAGPGDGIPLGGGVGAWNVRLINLGDVGEWVYKEVKMRGEADAEELASLLGEALGANVPPIYRTGERDLWMPYVGTGAALGWAPVPTSLAAQILGLFHVLTADGDANRLNIIMDADGEPWGIDFSGSFVPLPPEYVGRIPEVTNSPMAGPWVSRTWRGALVESFEYVPNALSRADVAYLAERIQSVRHHFEALGYPDWFDLVWSRWLQIADKAQGERSIFE
ncbi:hypothetical protein [Microtetraspora sp. NBRC 13810]|uniref:WXG100-like domain-containing protein n=1 Tax=Microtetraspora sp. NBRC 13810 TaxID=3030990 RepID=UPI00255310DB|nr:hypothetical protein [Microtetraspora sp. NBRC 13810]